MKRIAASLVLASFAIAAPDVPSNGDVDDSNVDDVVQEALEAAGIPCTNDKEGNFLLSLKFKSGRSQKLVILSSRLALGEHEDEDEDELREIYSVALTSNEPPNAELSARLLEASASAKLGGWAVRKNGEKYETVYRAFVPADMCEHGLMPALALVATQADALEKSQTSKDEN